MTLHLKSRGYPFRPRLLFSSFIVVGVGFPTVYYFRRGQNRKVPPLELEFHPMEPRIEADETKKERRCR